MEETRLQCRLSDSELAVLLVLSFRKSRKILEIPLPVFDGIRRREASAEGPIGPVRVVCPQKRWEARPETPWQVL